MARVFFHRDKETSIKLLHQALQEASEALRTGERTHASEAIKISCEAILEAEKDIPEIRKLVEEISYQIAGAIGENFVL